MSQAKVDKYKQEKKNRAQIMKRQKRNALAAKLVGCLVAVALIGWVGISIYRTATPETTETYTVDAGALDDYMAQLSEETEAVAETESETASEEEIEETTNQDAESEAGSEAE